MIKISLLTVSLFALALSPAFGDEYPSCAITAESQVAFSSEDASDRLTITISGTPCWKARLDISITAEDGRRLYHYHKLFKRHVPVQWDDPGLAKAAERLARRLIEQDSFGRTNELPIWSPNDEYYEANYQVVVLDRNYYNDLREMDWITFTHLIHYEGWRVVAFDQKLQRAVPVSAGTL